MKRRLIRIAAAAIALIAAMAMTGCSAAPAAAQQPAANQPSIATQGVRLIDASGEEIIANKLTVSASGVKKAMPDVAYLTVAVTKQDKSMKKAQSANRETMNKLIGALKSAGLKDDDIRTINYSANPIYDYTSVSGKITAYEVMNTAELTIKDIDAVGDYIDIAAANGANASYSIRFDILDSSGFYNEALADAVGKARAKADAIAAAGGYGIISTLEISESQSYYYPQYGRYGMADVAAEESPTPVSAGELEITANVTIVYQIQ